MQQRAINPANVLIVDDEVGARESLKMILKPSFNTYTAEDGKGALEAIQRIPVDLVILDLRMPGMPGEEVLKHIKGYDSTIEVVIITGYGTLQSALEAIKYNVFDLILKPFDVPDVLSTVKRCIERRERATKKRKTSMDVDIDHDLPEGGLISRRHPRYDISVPVSLRLADKADLPQVFKAQTVNVSREGVAIAVYEREATMRLLPPLLSKEQPVELKISQPPTAEWVTSIGQARWLNIHSDEEREYLRVGIFLKQMDAEYRRKWEDFVEKVALEAGEES